MKERKFNRLLPGLIGILSCLLLYQVILAAQSMGDYPEKIWLHRCNSLEKLHEKKHLYDNIEVDVVFREADNAFDVTHDLDTTFHLSIDPYFDYFEETEGRIWLDFKNLSAANKDSAYQELLELCDEYQIEKERLIIESPSWEHLKLFTDNGFYTSLYVSFPSPSELTEAEEDSCVHQLQAITDSRSVKALSFPYWWYSEIKEKLHRSIDLLTWKHRTTQFMFLLSNEGKKMLKDNQLKVVLVKDKGNFHR